MSIQPVLWTLKFPSSPQRVNAETTYLTIREATGYAVKCSDNPLLVALYHADDVADKDARIAELTAEVARADEVIISSQASQVSAISEAESLRYAMKQIVNLTSFMTESTYKTCMDVADIARNALKEG